MRLNQPNARTTNATDGGSSCVFVDDGAGGEWDATRAVPTPPPPRSTQRAPPPLPLGSNPATDSPPGSSPLLSGADSYTMTEAERPRVMSRDPAGFTIVDVAAWGSLAHIISAGEILGQKAAGFF